MSRKYRMTKRGLILRVQKLQSTLSGMKQRCNNPNNSNYKYYGALGITVCDYWVIYPDKFFDWSIKNGYNIGMEIHRKNPHKGYDPWNCVWLIPEEHQVVHQRIREIMKGD